MSSESLVGVGVDEVEIFAAKHDVYPLIDPKPLWTKQAFKGQVVLITGASRGIGLTGALFYARAGAAVVLVARKKANLDEGKDTILKEVPGAQVLTIPVDITNHEDAARAVKLTVDAFGRLDILICNAGTLTPMTQLLADKDPLAWWFTQEVNVRGVFNFVHAAIPQLSKTSGQIIVTSSGAAHVRMPNTSDYIVSKHAVDRLVELVPLGWFTSTVFYFMSSSWYCKEHPSIKAYAIHPGVIETELNKSSLGPIPITDTVELPAATFLWLTAQKTEWLNERYIQATWDLEEVSQYRDAIVKDNLLVTKLVAPPRNV